MIDRTHFLSCVPALMLGCALAAPACADSRVETLIGHIGPTDAQGVAIVELRLLNSGDAPSTIALPERIEAQIENDDRTHPVLIERTADTQAAMTIAPGSFGQARYRLPANSLSTDALLSIPGWSEQRIALRRLPDSQQAATKQADMEQSGTSLAAARQSAAPAAALPPADVVPPDDRGAGNAFIGNLGPYEPIYAAFGPGTNTEARIQLSFEYRLFGSRSARLPGSWRDGLHLAYTQRMFWDLGADSAPFRNIDYQPELIYITPDRQVKKNVSVALQGGIRHESNGRDGLASRSINSIYIAPMAAISLGGERRLLVAPRLSFYVGDRSDNPDIADYRGHTGLFMQVGDENGLRLSTNSRLNFSTGKGAINADLSYPLPRLLGGGPDLYLFAQGFAGYGENLLDYNRSITRLRIGLALVR